MNTGENAEEKGKGAGNVGQDTIQSMGDGIEHDWTCVQKGGKHSPRKQREETSRAKQASAKITKVTETISPSRFNVLSNTNKIEDDQEEGEIGAEVSSKGEENHSSSSSSEDEAPPKPVQQRGGSNRRKKNGQNKPITNGRDQKLAPSNNTKRSSSRRN